MSKQTLVLILIIILIFGNVELAISYSSAKKTLADVQSQVTGETYNRRVVEFTTLFINKVLQADREVDFETRLQLENQVRGLNNPEILASWQQFTNSRTEAEAQQRVKQFLAILVSSLKIDPTARPAIKS